MVGDDDQAIYGWRGSDVRYITDFATTRKGTVVVRLKRNYRSPEGIVRLSSALISRNKSRLQKQFLGDASRTAKVIVCEAETEADEAAWIGEQIKRHVSVGTTTRSEVAVLVRASYVSRAIQAALRRVQVPFSVRGATLFWKTPEVRKIVKVLSATAKGLLDFGPSLEYLDKRLFEIVRTNAPKLLAQLAQEIADGIADMPPYRMAEERKIDWAGNVREVASIAGKFEEAESFLTYVASTFDEQANGADNLQVHFLCCSAYG